LVADIVNATHNGNSVKGSDSSPIRNQASGRVDSLVVKGRKRSALKLIAPRPARDTTNPSQRLHDKSALLAMAGQNCSRRTPRHRRYRMLTGDSYAPASGSENDERKRKTRTAACTHQPTIHVGCRALRQTRQRPSFFPT
jgi:hypothetical protein